MLISASISNFYSFNEEVHFSMIASPDASHPDHVFYELGAEDPGILSFSVLYGANASGKSNFVEAFYYIRDFILSTPKPRETLSCHPFLLARDKSSSPSRFDITFYHKLVVYNYGFELTKEKVVSEWLYAKYGEKEKLVFERFTEGNEVKVNHGPLLAKKRTKKASFVEYVVRGTRPNQLFLTEADNKNIEIVSPVVEWFNDVLTIIHATSHYSDLEVRAARDKDFSDSISSFLKAAGTGVSRIEAKKRKFDIKSTGVNDDNIRFLKEVLDNASPDVGFRARENSVITKDEDGETFYITELVSHHKASDGTLVEFPFSSESDGTRRLTHLIPALFNSMQETQVYIIDELDRSLHPLLSKFFIEQFFECSKKTKSQIVCTTHDTNLLDLNVLRKDEVWFVEKDELGATHLTPLVKFKFDKNVNIQKGYLVGRFGAIPLVSDLKRLGWEDNGCSQG